MLLAPLKGGGGEEEPPGADFVVEAISGGFGEARPDLAHTPGRGRGHVGPRDSLWEKGAHLGAGFRLSGYGRRATPCPGPQRAFGVPIRK